MCGSKDEMQRCDAKMRLTQEKQKKKAYKQKPNHSPNLFGRNFIWEVKSIIQECYHLLFSLSLFIVFYGNQVTVIMSGILLAFTDLKNPNAI